MSEFQKLEKYNEALVLPQPEGLKFTAICDATNKIIKVGGKHERMLTPLVTGMYSSCLDRIRRSWPLFIKGTFTLTPHERSLVELTMDDTQHTCPYLYALHEECPISNKLRPKLPIDFCSWDEESNLLDNFRTIASYGFDVIPHHHYIKEVSTEEEYLDFLHDVNYRFSVSPRLRVVDLKPGALFAD